MLVAFEFLENGLKLLADRAFAHCYSVISSASPFEGVGQKGGGEGERGSWKEKGGVAEFLIVQDTVVRDCVAVLHSAISVHEVGSPPCLEPLNVFTAYPFIRTRIYRRQCHNCFLKSARDTYHFFAFLCLYHTKIFSTSEVQASTHACDYVRNP